MPAAKYDFTIEQGSSFDMSLTYKDADDNIKDITGWCGRLVWETNEGVVQKFHSTNLDLSLYRFEILGGSGLVSINFPYSLTNQFMFKTANYDLELQSPDPQYVGGTDKEVIRLLHGVITIDRRNSLTNTVIDCQ